MILKPKAALGGATLAIAAAIALVLILKPVLLNRFGDLMWWLLQTAFQAIWALFSPIFRAF